MPIYDAASRIIAAFQAGQQERLQQERFQQEQEDRKLQQESLRLALAQHRLEGKFQARQLQLQTHQLLNGLTPEANLTPDQMAGGILPSQNLSASEAAQAPNTMRPMTIQGIPEMGVPDISLPLQTKEQKLQDLLAQRMAEGRIKALTEITKVGPGEIAYQGGRELARGGSKPVNLSHVNARINGQDVIGAFNPETGEVKSTGARQTPPASMRVNLGLGTEGRAGVGPSTTPGDQRNLEVLKRLPTPIANEVIAVAEGRMPLWPASRLNPQNEVKRRALMEYDPSYDFVSPSKRMTTARAFAAGGKVGQGINAFGTALRHASLLSDLIEKLDNGKLRRYNSVANWLKTETGSPEVRQFSNTMQKFSQEMVRAWRGTGGDQADIEENRKAMDAADSVETLRQVLADNVELLHGKIAETEDQYRTDMNAEPTFWQKGWETSIRKINQKAGRDSSWLDEQRAGRGAQPVSGAAAPANAPQQAPIPGVPGGIAELRNGKWIRVK